MRKESFSILLNGKDTKSKYIAFKFTAYSIIYSFLHSYSSEATWEPIENTNCPLLIAKYEQKLKEYASEDEPHPKLSFNGFDMGYEPEQIVGATEANGQLYYLVKWRYKLAREYVFSKLVHKHCPQLLIAFYEKHSEYSKKK